ncbi:MAG: cupin domain-containing protein [Saprospiraceae bacterium]|nr:cupin domain-containing protein [Saprospiraceae bacterium]MCF8252261.1 cupin domain-containing protein [Saprospiraceae bacterium]MCF8283090.1 cupin domain-containing protein [Bacteroidales bacterium]MCF8313910.1 cupin domain-containing protein [Saprospiraceae bacterium]MCF8443134.1 cupin domain-containing protein [Saprospiraceae bacterium]
MDKIISRLQHLINEVPRQIQQFSPDEMSLKPDSNKWSKREILGHLCDSALHNWQRFCLAQQTDESLQIVRYQQDTLVAQNNWQGQPTGSVVALWASLNTQIVAVLKNLPMEKLPHPIVLPDGTAATLQFLIEDYLDHLEHHLGQIFTEKINPPTLPERWKISSDEALSILKNHPDGKPFVTLLEDGRMYVEVYQPKKFDLQKPHDQDEIYVVISGSGTFFNNGERRPFAAGDLLFVPAGVEHRFEDFTDGFATWVVFY